MNNQKTGTAGAEGLDYQLNLILVCLLRGTKLYGERFKLTTELKSAGKFDDLILFYSESDGKEYKRCLQAKHKVKTDTQIDENDLMNDTKKGLKLNLYTYFKSYREDLMQSNTDEAVLKDIIIFTNSKFNQDVLKLVDAIETPDNLFHFGVEKPDGTLPKFYKFNYIFQEKFQCYKKAKLNEVELRDLNSFFDLLIFGVNQPNDQELKSYIQNEIMHSSTSEAETALLVPNLIDKVRDWFKEKEISYLSKAEMNQFSEYVNRQIVALSQLNMSETFCEKLRAHQINFQTINFQQKLNVFLCDKDKSIFFMQAIKKYTRLTSIKTLHALQNSDPKSKFLFIPLKKDMMRKIMKLISLFVQSKECTVLAMEVIDVQLLDTIYFQLDKLIEEQKLKKIIIISEEFSLPGEYQAICEKSCDETHYHHLSQETRANLFDRKIIFQGVKVPLKKVFFEKDVSKFAPTNWWLSLMFNRKINIGPEMQLSNDYNFKYYIPRKPYQKTVVPDKELKFIKKQDIVVSTSEEYQKQIEENPKRNIHLLMKCPKNDVWVWHKTAGKISNIRKRITNHYVTTNIIEDSKLHIIADNAGMGKSTIISHNAWELKKADPLFWLIRFNLIAFPFELSQFGETKSANANKFICSQLLKFSQHSVEETLFYSKMASTSSAKMIFIFDGFDEVNEVCQKSVISIIKNLLNRTSVKRIIISTRPHLQKKLENEFSQFAINLHPFTKEDKIEFLIKYWSRGAKLKNTRRKVRGKIKKKIKHFADQVLVSFSKEISDHFSQFTGVPLQMRMIAEILENDAMSYVKGESTSVMTWTSNSLVNIYEQFIDKKTDIYKREKAKLTTKNDEIENALNARVLRIKNLHAELAMNIMFKSEASVNETDDEMIKSMLKFGLVHEINGKLYFIHQTFAEYYIAMFLMAKISLPNYDVRQCLVQINNLFLSNVRLFINDLITIDVTVYDHLKTHFLSIIRLDTSHLFINNFILPHYGPNPNLKILELLLECIHEIDETNGSSYIISSLMKSSKYSFIAGQRTKILKFLIDNIKSLYNPKSVIFKELVSSLIDSMSTLCTHPDKKYYDEFRDLVKYIIDFLIFVEEKEYLDGEIISDELKNLSLVNASYDDCEFSLLMLDYAYDNRVNVLAELLQKNVGYICDPRSSVYFNWLETKTNISSTLILNLMLDWCIEWMYVNNNNSFILNNYLTTVLNHSKAKYDVEELKTISDPSFTVPFQENFKRFFKMSPSNDMDKILIGFVNEHFGPQSPNHFFQVPDNEILQIEYYCLWNRFERVQYLLEDSNVKSVRKKMVEILKSLKQRSSLDVFNQIISKRNEYKESILQRACRENDTSQLDLISSWIDSDEIFETLTSIKDKSAFFLCSTLLNLINEKFPDRVIEFLFSNSDVYFQEEFYDMAYHPDKDSYRECCRSLFDSLLNVIEERFNKDNFLRLLIINESVFADMCAKMIYNDYYKGGVGRLLSIIENKVLSNAEIFLLMSQKNKNCGIIKGITIYFMETNKNFQTPPNSSIIRDFMKKNLNDNQIVEISKPKENFWE